MNSPAAWLPAKPGTRRTYRGDSKVLQFGCRNIPSSMRDCTHGDFSGLEFQRRTLEQFPVFVCGSLQALKWASSELSANGDMADDGTLNLERQIAEGFGLGHEIIFQTPGRPAVLALAQQEVELQSLRHDGKSTLRR